MKQLFTFIIALFAFAAVQAQTPIDLINGNFEDLTDMAKNTNGKWAIKGFYLTDVALTPAGNYVNDANSGLAPGQGDGSSQAFKVAVVHPDATSNTTYQVIALSTEPIDISNREFGRYNHKFYLKPGEPLNAKRPFTYTYVVTDENGVDVTAFTATVDDVARQALNANADFKTQPAATAGYQALQSLVDIKANTNTDPSLGSVLNAKYLTFQFNFGKNLNVNTALLTNTYFFDNFTLTGPAEKTTTKIDDRAASFDLKVYPNPARENLTVSCTNGIDEIAVFSLTGAFKNKIPVGSNNYNLNISQLPKGSYIIVVKNSKGVVKKIITKM